MKERARERRSCRWACRVFSCHGVGTSLYAEFHPTSYPSCDFTSRSLLAVTLSLSYFLHRRGVTKSRCFLSLLTFGNNNISYLHSCLFLRNMSAAASFIDDGEDAYYYQPRSRAATGPFRTVESSSGARPRQVRFGPPPVTSYRSAQQRYPVLITLHSFKSLLIKALGS